MVRLLALPLSQCLRDRTLKRSPIDHRHVFYADERVVPLDHEDSNHALYTRELFGKLPADGPQLTIHTINAELANDLEELTDAYKRELVTDIMVKAKQIEYLINSLPQPESEEAQVCDHPSVFLL